jgi:O-acetyl-ADP-ribose deacetylase (regulator of RNase III)
MKFSMYVGDLADARADAVCTSTNPRLSLMMGSGASVRARGGSAVLRGCDTMPDLPPGAVHPTTAGMLPHKIAIHCVASDAAHRSSLAIVQACVRNALACADRAGCSSIAMPVFGTGHARLPFADAARAMARAALETTSGVGEIKFVTNREELADELHAVLREFMKTVTIERSPDLEPEPVSLWSEDYSLQ